MIKKVILQICFSFICCSLLFAGEDAILAKAGDHTFRQSDFDKLLSFSPPYFSMQLQQNPQQKVVIIKKIMEHRIIADLARREGLDREEDVKLQMNYMVNDLLSREYLIKEMKKGAAPTEDDLKKYYHDNEERYTIPEQVRARHILIKVAFGAPDEEKKKSEEKIKNILEWLKKGEKFETLAEQYSEDAQSAKQGGELGFFPRGKMAKPFEDAAFSMKPGQISDIVKTDYGYHIISVEERKEESKRSFEEVREEIDLQLTDEKSKTLVNELVSKAVQDAGLEIYEDRITGKSGK